MSDKCVRCGKTNTPTAGCAYCIQAAMADNAEQLTALKADLRELQRDCHNAVTRILREQTFGEVARAHNDGMVEGARKLKGYIDAFCRKHGIEVDDENV